MEEEAGVGSGTEGRLSAEAECGIAAAAAVALAATSLEATAGKAPSDCKFDCNGADEGRCGAGCTAGCEYAGSGGEG
jgi:hypothetical protein